MTEYKKNGGGRAAQVLIVDDHPVVREGLAARIARESDLEFGGEAADPAMALKLVASIGPDVVVVDISLKSGSGIDLIKRIREQYPTVRMLAWSIHTDSLYAERALRAGAMGFINKEHATDNIIDAIRQVLAGKIYLSGQMAERILHRAVNGSSKGPSVESLSDRELEAFQLIGQGLDTHQAAERMHCSPKTVETYRARIKEKLNLESGHKLMQTAVQWVIESTK